MWLSILYNDGKRATHHHQNTKGIQKYYFRAKNCVYTDHKNLMYKAHNFARVMRWQLLIEEFGPKLFYLPGTNNVVADCLSKLEYDDHDVVNNHFALDKSDLNKYPLSYKLIMKYQQKDT